MSAVDQIAAALSGNQFLAGMVGATLTGGALYALRQAPGKVFAALKETFSTTLVIDSDDPSYSHVSVWLSRHAAAKKARRLMMAESYDYEKGRWSLQITLGQGWHVVMVEGRPLLVHRHIQEADALGKALGGGRQQRLTLTTIGRDQTALRSLISMAEDQYHGRGMVEVLFWSGGCYEVADRRRARSLDTIYLPPEQKRRLVDDLTTFVASRDEYARRGVPWRRGLFLEGPPGTGKTSLIQALAGIIGRSVYVVNLNTLGGDNDLIRAVNQVGWDGVLVIEDIDAIKVTHDRTAAPSPAPSGNLVAIPGAEAQPRGITLSGLLNAIDGLTAREGRIMFMTSNHPDSLDAALVRPGRVDRREHIGLLNAPEAYAMFRAYRPDAPDGEFELDILPSLPMSAAALQGALLTWAPDNEPEQPVAANDRLDTAA